MGPEHPVEMGFDGSLLDVEFARNIPVLGSLQKQIDDDFFARSHLVSLQLPAPSSRQVLRELRAEIAN